MNHTETTAPSLDTLIGGMSSYERFSLSKELKQITGILKPNETPIQTLKVYCKKKFGLLIVTPDALHFISCGLFWGTQIQSFAYSSIVNVYSRTDLLNGSVTINLKNSESVSFTQIQNAKIPELKNFITGHLA